MISKYAAVYLEVNLIGIVLSLMILLKIRQERNLQMSNTTLKRVAFSILFILFTDALWVLIDSRPYSFLIPVNYLVNVSYMFLTGLIPYFWMQFVFCKFQVNLQIKKVYKILIITPLFGLLILCVTSPWTHWLFEVTAENVYLRGSLHFLQEIIGYTYTIATGVYALVHSIRETNTEKRAEAVTLCLFSVLPSIGGIVSVLIFGMPTIWPFTSVSLIMVYMNLQSWQISTDSLTGLNNRRQFDKYLRLQTTDRRRDSQLYLMLIDIDNFKMINDTFGHAIGDHALVQTATILKQVCNNLNAFLARYGGDEFAIILEVHDKSEILRLKNHINLAFDEFNRQHETAYCLKFSSGVSLYSHEASTPLAMIEEADKLLYKSKSEKRRVAD